MNTYKFLLNGKVVNRRTNNRSYNYALYRAWKYNENFLQSEIDAKIELYKKAIATKNFELIRDHINAGYGPKTFFEDNLRRGRVRKGFEGIKHPARNFDISFRGFEDQLTFENLVIDHGKYVEFKVPYVGWEGCEHDWIWKGNMFDNIQYSKEEIESFVPVRKLGFSSHNLRKSIKGEQIHFSRNRDFTNVVFHRHLIKSEQFDYNIEKIVPVVNGIAEYNNDKVAQ